MSSSRDGVALAEAALDRVVAIQARIDALAAERAEALHAFDEAFTAAYPPSAEQFRARAARAEVACALRVSEWAAETLMGEARVLTRIPPATAWRTSPCSPQPSTRPRSSSGRRAPQGGRAPTATRALSPSCARM